MVPASYCIGHSLRSAIEVRVGTIDLGGIPARTPMGNFLKAVLEKLFINGHENVLRELGEK
jgi:hypothetical protein